MAHHNPDPGARAATSACADDAGPACDCGSGQVLKRARSWHARRLALLMVVLVVGLGGAVAWRVSLYPKRFAEVVPGRLYRSGEMTPAQLERVVREKDIHTVLSLLDPNVPESQAERAAAQRLGIRWLNIPLRGDGSSAASDRDAIRAIVLDPNLGPLLVHCAAGANRTGLAVGMYRIHADGWTCEEVLKEMRSHGFDDLPKHENLRDALTVEAALAQEAEHVPAQSASQPARAERR